MIEIKTQEEFDTIFATGTSMPSNELIRIFPLEGGGEYITEGIEITKSNVIIEGINKPKIKQNTTATDKDIIFIQGTGTTIGNVRENIIIRGLHLIGGKEHEGGQTGQHGIFIENCGFAQTTGLTSGTYSRYDSSTVGVDKPNKIGVRIENCIIKDCRSYGIMLSSSSNNTITGNTIQNNSNRGIYLDSSSNNTITGNTVQNNNSYGIRLTSSSNNTITGNTVQNNNSEGIALSSSNNNTITGNTVQNNRYSEIYLVTSSSNNTITGNTIQNNNNYGIRFTSSNNNTITGNTVQNNGYGIYLITSSNNNTITGNTVQNNNREGINLNGSNNTITGNTVQNNGTYGIYLLGSSRNCITNNIVYQNNDVGIQLNGTGNNYNNIYGNISQSNTGGNYSSGGGTGNQIWANMNIY